MRNISMVLEQLFEIPRHRMLICCPCPPSLDVCPRISVIHDFDYERWQALEKLPEDLFDFECFGLHWLDLCPIQWQDWLRRMRRRREDSCWGSAVNKPTLWVLCIERSANIVYSYTRAEAWRMILEFNEEQSIEVIRTRYDTAHMRSEQRPRDRRQGTSMVASETSSETTRKCNSSSDYGRQWIERVSSSVGRPSGPAFARAEMVS